MSNLEIYNKFRLVPDEAKKTIQAGRTKGFTDINPMWRIKTLTEHFGAVGFGWYYEIKRMWLEAGANDEQSAFVEINLFVKSGEEWSKPITGIGGSAFVAKESRGLYTSDECYKMALTDALSVSCKALGIGADVYYSKDLSKYDKQKDLDDKNGAIVKPPKEYKCAECGKPFEAFTLNGKEYTSEQAFKECQVRSTDHVARCKTCRAKLKPSEQTAQEDKNE